MTSTSVHLPSSRARSLGSLAIVGLAYLLLVLTALSMIFPFYWMVATSLKTEARVFAFPPEWVPNPAIASNYLYIFTKLPFGLYVYNSLKVSLLWTLGVVLSSSLAAYAFAWVRFRGRGTLFMITLAALMIPGQITMIPLYVIMSRIGWVDTHLPLIVPAYFGSAFGIFLLRQYFLTIPRGTQRCGQDRWLQPFRHLLAHHDAPFQASAGYIGAAGFLGQLE